MAVAPSIKVQSANDRVIVGLVGGGRWCDTLVGRSLLREGQEANLCRVAGISDTSKTCRAAAKESLDLANCPEYEDYRKLLEDQSIDAILCSVEDHQHAPVILDALKAGKHVYVIPPLCRYLPEAFSIWDTCKQTNKIIQVGVQTCSDPKWHKASELIRDGRIGPVIMAQGSYMRNTPKGEWNGNILPWGTKDDVNWQLWTGGTGKVRREFNSEEYFRWRKYYRYSAGLLAALLPLAIHPYLLALGNPGFPVRVAAMGVKKFHTDARVPGTPERDSPEIIQVIAEFSGGCSVHFVASSVNEQGTPEIIRGHKASLLMAGNKLTLKPEPAFADDNKLEFFGPFEPASQRTHFTNWIESIRGNQQPNCGIELAVRAQTLISLAEMSDRLNQVCLFDEANRKVHDGFGNEIKPLTAG